METNFRIFMTILISIVCIYYTYLILKLWVLIQKNKDNFFSNNKKILKELKKKFIPTIFTTLSMSVIGILHLTEINSIYLDHLLTLDLIFVVIIGEKWFISIYEIRNIEKEISN